MRILPSKAKVYCFDLDGVLTNESGIPNYANQTPEEVQDYYDLMTPNEANVKVIQELFNSEAVFVKIFTARSDYHHNTTVKWLAKHGIKYDRLIFNKEYYDVFIDDHAWNTNEQFLRDTKK